MPSRSEFAIRFGVVSVLLLALAGSLAVLLLRCFPPAPDQAPNHFPVAFAVSTLFLLLGSVVLSRARGYVRRERQRLFRRNLRLALAAGTLFVSMQAYTLTCLIRQQPAEEAPIGAGAFVAVIAALHAMHFVVAMLFLVYITVQAHEDRYDHEYFWGVTVCTWFWHVLGIIWAMVLVVILIATVT